VSATFFGALADAGVNVELISTSEIRISIVIREDDVPAAVQAVHSAFDLDSDDEVATVYAGTGGERGTGAGGSAGRCRRRDRPGRVSCCAAARRARLPRR
jgi:hypothetical protein